MDDIKNLVARLEIVQDHLFEAGLKPMGATVKEAISALNESAKLSANCAKGGETPKPCGNCEHGDEPEFCISCVHGSATDFFQPRTAT